MPPHLLLLAARLGAAAHAGFDISLQARAFQPGEALLVEVSSHAALARGRFLGRPVEFFPAGSGRWLAVLGLDLEVATGTATLELTLSEEDGRPHFWSSAVPIRAKAFPTRKLKVDDRFVRLSPEDEARAEREAERLRALFARVSPRRLFFGRFRSPIRAAPSARFGERRIFNGVPKAPHSGADLKAEVGAPVCAAAGGLVVLAEPLFYAGKTVVLDHGWGVFSSYSHLSEIDVVEGERVAAGSIVGRVGATGRVTAAHLHWAVRVGGARVDPFSLLHLDFDR